MATPQVRHVLRMFDSWYVTLNRDNPGMTTDTFAFCLFVEFDERDELSCYATWYREFREKNPGMTTKSVAFCVFLEKMKNERARRMEATGQA